jgi:hypothetical protein
VPASTCGVLAERVLLMLAQLSAIVYNAPPHRFNAFWEGLVGKVTLSWDRLGDGKVGVWGGLWWWRWREVEVARLLEWLAEAAIEFFSLDMVGASMPCSYRPWEGSASCSLSRPLSPSAPTERLSLETRTLAKWKKKLWLL